MTTPQKTKPAQKSHVLDCVTGLITGIIGILFFLDGIKILLLPVTVPLGAWFVWHHWPSRPGTVVWVITILGVVIVGCLLGGLMKQRRSRK